MTKFKKRKAEQALLQNGSAEFAGTSNSNEQNIRNNTVSERFGKILRKINPKKVIETTSNDENSQPSGSVSSSDNEENRVSDDAADRLECKEDMSSIIGDIGPSKREQRKQKNPVKYRNQTLFDGADMIDLNFWAQRKTCCGYVYESKKYGSVFVDLSKYSRELCSVHAKLVPSVCEMKEEFIKMPTAMKSLPLKKQHFLRQCIINSTPIIPLIIPPTIEPMEQSAPIDYSKPTIKSATQQPNAHTINEPRGSNSVLLKTRTDTGKVVKKTPRKTLNAAKNLIKLCTSNPFTVTTNPEVIEKKNNSNEQTKANEHNENENITNTTTKTEPIAINKFSDNSSDSGYEETLHDTTQLNQIAKIGTSRPVILSNGIKLHVKPENLLLAANLAGVSQTAIQTTQVN